MRLKPLAALRVYYDETFRFGAELDLYIRLALANPTKRFAHDPRVLIHRGAGKTQFSVRYRGYRILDTCTILSKYGQTIEDDQIREESMTCARKLIARDLIAQLRRRDAALMREVLFSNTFLHWVISKPLNALWILRMGFIAGMRGLRDLFQASGGGGSE
jgi:hypothetical protein